MFEYQRLDLRGSGFRLVRLQKGDGVMIECELIHTTLDDNVIPYEAVSYTWGALKRERHVYVKGEILPVTSNLWQVLYDLRRPDIDRYLWVDGVCINQDDNIERGHQVQQMKDIYQRADHGIFYLSPYTDIVQVIMASLTLLQKKVAGTHWPTKDERWGSAWQKVRRELPTGSNVLQMRGLTYLLNCSFFSRVWILQEVASVCRSSVYCGTASISAHIFAMGPPLLGIAQNPHIRAILTLMRRPLCARAIPFRRSLACLLQNFGLSKASDERDRIYALLGLCETRKNAQSITPDYTLSIGIVVERALAHIYGPYLPSFLSHIKTVDTLVGHLRTPASNVIAYLLRSKQSQEAIFDYIAGVELLIRIPNDLATAVLRHLIQSSRWPIEVLHNYFARLDKRLDTIPHEIVSLAMEKVWYADILNLLCHNGQHVVIDAQVSFILQTRHTRMQKILVTPCEAEIVIHVSMRELWVILLLAPDDDIEALIPLLHGIDSRTNAALIHLRDTASKLAGSFRSRDAIMLLWRLVGNTKSKHNDDSMPIKDKATRGITSAMLKDHFSGRPIQIDPRLNLSSTGKWQLK